MFFAGRMLVQYSMLLPLMTIYYNSTDGNTGVCSTVCKQSDWFWPQVTTEGEGGDAHLAGKCGHRWKDYHLEDLRAQLVQFAKQR